VDVVLILIPLSAAVILAAVGIFLWAVDHGQFEDLERQGRESLFEIESDTEASAAAPRERGDGKKTWSS
jgi:cbb3-type cytochrome oxidase maturation protein